MAPWLTCLVARSFSEHDFGIAALAFSDDEVRFCCGDSATSLAHVLCAGVGVGVGVLCRAS